MRFTQDLYADVFRNHVNLLFEQVDAGLYSLKRYGYYLQKMCSHRKPALIDLLKDTEHESSKKDRAEMDRAGNYVRAYRHMQDIQFQLLHEELKFVTSVNETVAEPLLAWHKNAEKRKEALKKREEKISKELKEVHAKVVSARKECHKQWQTIQGAYKDFAKIESHIKENPQKPKYNAKDLANAESKIEKERAKAILLFSTLETAVANANRTQDAYWNTELPSLLQDLEHLEAERLSMLGSHMLLYSHLQQGQVQPLANAAAMLVDDVQALNGAEEMKDIASSILRQHGGAQGPAVLQPQLPCSSNDLSTMAVGSLYMLLGQDMNVSIEQCKEKDSIVHTVIVNTTHPVLAKFPALTDTPITPPAPPVSAAAPPSFLPPQVPSGFNSASVPESIGDEEYVKVDRSGVSKDPVPPVPTPQNLPPLPASHLPTPATRSSIGVFPVNVPKGTVCLCAGLFDFDGTDDEDLVFSENDLIAVFFQPEQSEWWVGVKFDGSTGETIARGAFPANYVEVLDNVQYTCL